MAATAVTLNDLEGHSPVAGLFNCNPSNIRVAFYTISTDSVLAWFLCISRASCSIYNIVDREGLIYLAPSRDKPQPETPIELSTHGHLAVRCLLNDYEVKCIRFNVAHCEW